MSSYGHAYLTSYGWTGTGAGLRKGAIAKPLAIPPKKNLSGLGKDRDEAFPFWDHLFTAASKTIKIRISSDDEVDDTEDPSSCTDPLRRTTTGIISNRRPITGTPASTSGSATPNLIPDTGTITDAHLAHAGATSRPSLLATAKREAAMRGLYARFFRGPVLGPDDDPRGRSVPGTAPSSSESSSLPSPVHQPIREQGPIPRETKKRKKRKTQNNVETREERKERKRLKKERMAAKVAKKAEKARAGVEVKEKKDRHDIDRKDKETWPRSEETSSLLRKTRKRARNSLVEEDREPAKRAEKQVGRRASPTNNEQQDSSYRPSTGNHADVTDALNTLLTTKKKRRKRKDTQP